MTPLAWVEEALSLAWRHWKAITGVAVLISVLVYIGILKGDISHYRKLSTQLAEQNKMLEATYAAASNTARANNLDAVRKAEADGNAISERKQDDLQKQLADARTLAADYARRMRTTTAANQDGSGQAGLPNAPSGPGSINDAGVSVIPSDDLRICAEQTVKVKGWIDFYTSVRDRYNSLATP